MEKVIIAFNSTEDASKASEVIQNAVSATRLIQERAVVVLTWCANLYEAGNALTEAKLEFSLVSSDHD